MGYCTAAVGVMMPDHRQLIYDAVSLTAVSSVSEWSILTATLGNGFIETSKNAQQR